MLTAFICDRLPAEGEAMIKRSLVSALAVLAICSLSPLGGCARSSADTSSTGVRNSQGQLVDPQTGIVLPGQGSGAGGSGGY
jgi:hypothetical protein